MVESIKEILISEKMHQLQEYQQIEQEINLLDKNEKKENFASMEKKLQEIENSIAELSKNKWKTVLNIMKIQQLNQEYRQVSHHKIEKLKQYNNSRNNLLARLNMACHDQTILKQEIKRIQAASSLKDLNLTKQKAEAMLRKYHHHEEVSAIQQAFLKIVSDKIKTKEDIQAKMKYLYQTNASSFYIEMNKITPREFARQLIEIEIVLEKEKLSFLEQFALSPNTIMFTNVQELVKNDSLDEYFNSEIEVILNRLKKSPTLSHMSLSQMMSLTALVSIAKENKKR